MKALTVLKLAVVGTLALLAVVTAVAGCDWMVTASLTTAAGIWAKILTA